MAFELAPEYASYDDVPWYRKRWFFALSLLFCIPVGAFIGLTGDVYALHEGEVKKLPASQRTMMVVTFLLLMGANLFTLLT